MIGAICGDIVGSIYEFDNIKTTDFEFFSKDSFFTDDSVMTVAAMDALMNGIGYAEAYKKWFRKYPDESYGGRFLGWCMSYDDKPYNSFGNGSAMRVSPIGLWYNTLDEVLEGAKRSAEVTHNHLEGIKGAQAVAAAIYLARIGSEKQEIKKYMEEKFNYKLDESVDSIRKWYRFDESCQGTVPQAIICFLESDSFEDAIRKAISIGGDSDTVACITGGIAEGYYGVPDDIREKTLSKLPEDIRSLVDLFYKKYNAR